MICLPLGKAFVPFHDVRNSTAEFWSNAEEVLVEGAAIERAEIQQAANQDLEAEVYVSEER